MTYAPRQDLWGLVECLCPWVGSQMISPARNLSGVARFALAFGLGRLSLPLDTKFGDSGSPRQCAMKDLLLSVRFRTLCGAPLSGVMT